MKNQNKNKEDSLLIWCIILISLVIILFAFIMVEEQNKNMKEDIDFCVKVNGTLKSYGLGYSCYGIDEQGYIFYWQYNEKGEVYKIK